MSAHCAICNQEFVYQDFEATFFALKTDWFSNFLGTKVIITSRASKKYINDLKKNIKALSVYVSDSKVGYRSRKKKSKTYWAKGTGYGGSKASGISAAESTSVKKNKIKVRQKMTELINNVIVCLESFNVLITDKVLFTQLAEVKQIYSVYKTRRKIRNEDKFVNKTYVSLIDILLGFIRSLSILDTNEEKFNSTLLSLVKVLFSKVNTKFLLVVSFPVLEAKNDTILSLLKNITNVPFSKEDYVAPKQKELYESISNLVACLEDYSRKQRVTEFIETLNEKKLTQAMTKTDVLVLGTTVSIEIKQILKDLENKTVTRKQKTKVLDLLVHLNPNDIESNALRSQTYCTLLKHLSFKSCQIKELATQHIVDYSFLSIATQGSYKNKKRMLRIARELTALSTSLPVCYGSSIFVRVDETQNDVLSFLIIGPDGTPYENGVFIFDCFFPSSYPSEPPKVLLKTTGGGRVRFNPNLYANGKVCLSLLGTWSGPSWSPETSTLLQVLISIQSLIFVSDPFFNEPGYEGQIGTPQGTLLSKQYNQRVATNTLRYAIYQALTKPNQLFKEVITLHFRLKADSIVRQLEDWAETYFDTNSSSTLVYSSKVKAHLTHYLSKKRKAVDLGSDSSVEIISLPDETEEKLEFIKLSATQQSTDSVQIIDTEVQVVY